MIVKSDANFIRNTGYIILMDDVFSHLNIFQRSNWNFDFKICVWNLFIKLSIKILNEFRNKLFFS